MQVVRATLTRQCPFILESDVLSLSSDFITLKNASVLHDTCTDAQHIVHAPGNHLVRALGAGTSYRNLCKLAEQKEVQTLQLCELLGFLNATGALHFARRNTMQKISAWYAQSRHLLLGVRYAGRTWRSGAAPSAIAVGAARACAPIAAAIIVVGGFFVSAGLFGIRETAGVGLFGWFGFVASLWVHEYSHVLTIRKQSQSVVLQDGMRLGIVHPALPPKAEIVSALLGPCAGMLWCGAVALIAIMFGYAMLGALSVCMGVFHLTSFLPWYGDGQSIRQALHKRRKVAA